MSIVQLAVSAIALGILIPYQLTGIRRQNYATARLLQSIDQEVISSGAGVYL